MQGAELRRGDFLRPFFESKVRPPPFRSAMVSRPALVDALDAPSGGHLRSIVAPAGYGKTTLLAEWAHRHPSKVAWLTLDQHDNDPSVFLAYVTAALERVGSVDRSLLGPSASRSVAVAASRLAHAMSEMGEDVVLVLDHMEALSDRMCLDTIAELALHLPRNAGLALASRADPPIPLPRMRASGRTVEIGVEELAMTDLEAHELLIGAGLDVSASELDEVIERTEGWPVGLYLAALALRGGASEAHAGLPFSGDDRFMAEYLRAEVLSGTSDDEVTFLTRTSVLERMTGSLCDALLHERSSARVLAGLARSNLLLVPLDRHDGWYRYHHLFRDLLRSELERREPGLARDLHLRAAEWCEANGWPEMAMEHALAARDPDRLNRLVLVNAQPMYSGGRRETLRRLFRWVEDEKLVGHYPALAVMGALFFSLTGDVVAATRWETAAEHPPDDVVLADGTTSAERSSPDRVLPDGSTLASYAAVFRIMRCRDGLDVMRRDAELAIDGLSPRSAFLPTALLARATCQLLAGDATAADQSLTLAAQTGLSAGANVTAVYALGQRALIAADRGDWPLVDELVAHARSIVTSFDLGDYGDCALYNVAAARSALRQGDLSKARESTARVDRSRAGLTWGTPWISAQTLVELARVYATMSDISGAREVLRQAADVVHDRPNLGVLVQQVDELRAKLDTMRRGDGYTSALTAAELRLVPFLPTHLTFREIGERLFVSRNTVKSQSISIYQKLGVSSRSEAIERLEDLGLLDPRT